MALAAPPRADAAGALAQLSEAGVRLVLTSGDSRPTAEAAAYLTGMFPAGARLGKEESLSAGEFGLLTRLQRQSFLAGPGNRLIYRAAPALKAALIEMMLERGGEEGPHDPYPSRRCVNADDPAFHTRSSSWNRLLFRFAASSETPKTNNKQHTPTPQATWWR